MHGDAVHRVGEADIAQLACLPEPLGA